MTILDKQKTNFYNESVDKVLETLQTSSNGLSMSEVEIRQKEFGQNKITSQKKSSPFLLFLQQFNNLLIMILIISAGISFGIGQSIEAIAIFVIVILAGLLGFIQEFKAEKDIDSLKKMSAPHATVFRNGKEEIILAEELVPGDIIYLVAGNTIPADARIIQEYRFKVNEAALTGESLPTEKKSNVIEKKNIIAGDQKNMIFMGTFVVSGTAKAIVTSIGMKTEFGKIANLLQTTEQRKTPLQQNLDHLGKRIGYVALFVALGMGLIGFFVEQQSFVDMFIWGVAIAVAVIPEALPAVVTISISLGVQRMVTRKALIRKLPAVETLGTINVICSDKTGTLTQDQMTVKEIYTNHTLFNVTGTGYQPTGFIIQDGKGIEVVENPNLKMLFEIGILCSDVNLVRNEDESWDIIGDPTEGAILVAAQKGEINYSKVRTENKRLFEIPFSSESKQMTTICEFNESKYAFSKGAIEVILKESNKILVNGNEIHLSEKTKEIIMQNVYSMSEKALRILAFAYKKIETEVEEPQNELVFVGFIGMMDPPREEVKEAIKTCFSAGIKPVMISGDYEVTAVAVARELGILQHGNSISGEELELLSDAELAEVVKDAEVFARISPAHKLRIVDAFMKQNLIVAMTGDGVNDAPSLKKADIGISMGIKGTDVSHEASDMILTDDNFSSIVAAIEEGRSIFQNIRKYLVYLLSGNFGTVLGLIIALFTFLPIPLTAIQILFINFLMDGLIAIAISMETPEKGLMKNKPRVVNEGVLNKQMLFYIFFIGLIIGIVTIGLFAWAVKTGIPPERATTIFFVSLIFTRLFNALNCRSFSIPALNINFASNRFLLVSYLISILFTIAVVDIPFMNKAFQTVPLLSSDWIIILCFTSIVWIFVEIYKIINMKKQVSL